MTVLKAIAHDLVEKRLWPVALILVALVVAVPMTLAKPGDPVIQAESPTESVAPVGPSLALSRVTTTGFARAPRVNDDRLDPFAIRNGARREKAAATLTAAADDVIDSANAGMGTGEAPAGGGGTAPTAPPSEPKTPKDKPKATTPKVETERDDLLSVLFIKGEEEPVELNEIRTLSPLPDTENPFLVYVGRASEDGRVSFLVSADAIHSGDGVCAPTPTDCRTLTMGIGDTADFVLVNQEGLKVSIAMTDIETKDVVVEGDADAEKAAELEAQTRAMGARALKSVIGDEDVLRSLMKQGVKLRS